MLDILGFIFVYGICFPLAVIGFIAALADLYRNR